jgi:tetratricopeptide (TPR) repeat protein
MFYWLLMSLTPSQAFDRLSELLVRKLGPTGTQAAEGYRVYLTLGLPEAQILSTFEQITAQFASVPDFVDHGTVAAVSSSVAVAAEAIPDVSDEELPDDSNESYNRGLELMQQIEMTLRSGQLTPLHEPVLQHIEALFDNALELAPEHGRAMIMRGMLFQFQGRSAEAVASIAPVLHPETGLEPNTRDWWIAATTTAEALASLGEISGANEWLEQILEEPQNDPETLFRLGKTYQKQGALQQAEQLLSDALELAPGDRRIRQVWQQVKNQLG